MLFTVRSNLRKVNCVVCHSACLKGYAQLIRKGKEKRFICLSCYSHALNLLHTQDQSIIDIIDNMKIDRINHSQDH